MPLNTTPMRSSLKRAKGAGSAKYGTHHWVMQRLTAIGLAVLFVWFLCALLNATLSSYAQAIAWLQNPITATLFALLLTVGLYHAKLGLQVVIEDYVHRKCCKIALLIGLNLGIVAAIALSLFSILKIAL